MSNKLFREREAVIAGPSSLKPPQLGAQTKTSEATLESQLGIQNFNERIERWFGEYVKWRQFLYDWLHLVGSTQQFSDRVIRGWK